MPEARMPETSEPELPGRTWIKAGPDPLRHEYGRENPDAGGAPIIDALAYVEEEPSGYFQWGTYTDPHRRGSAPSRMQAQAQAERVLTRADTASEHPDPNG